MTWSCNLPLAFNTYTNIGKLYDNLSNSKTV